MKTQNQLILCTLFTLSISTTLWGNDIDVDSIVTEIKEAYRSKPQFFPIANLEPETVRTIRARVNAYSAAHKAHIFTALYDFMQVGIGQYKRSFKVEDKTLAATTALCKLLEALMLVHQIVTSIANPAVSQVYVFLVKQIYDMSVLANGQVMHLEPDYPAELSTETYKAETRKWLYFAAEHNLLHKQEVDLPILAIQKRTSIPWDLCSEVRSALSCSLIQNSIRRE